MLHGFYDESFWFLLQEAQACCCHGYANADAWHIKRCACPKNVNHRRERERGGKDGMSHCLAMPCHIFVRVCQRYQIKRYPEVCWEKLGRLLGGLSPLSRRFLFTVFSFSLLERRKEKEAGRQAWGMVVGVWGRTHKSKERKLNQKRARQTKSRQRKKEPSFPLKV